MASLSLVAIYAPQNLDKLKQGVTEELAHFIRDGVNATELADAKKALQQEREIARAQDGALSAALDGQLQIGRAMAFNAKVDAAIAALTVEQVNAALRKHIDPAQLFQVYAGDFKTPDPALRRPASAMLRRLAGVSRCRLRLGRDSVRRRQVRQRAAVATEQAQLARQIVLVSQLDADADQAHRTPAALETHPQQLSKTRRRQLASAVLYRGLVEIIELELDRQTLERGLPLRAMRALKRSISSGSLDRQAATSGRSTA